MPSPKMLSSIQKSVKQVFEYQIFRTILTMRCQLKACRALLLREDFVEINARCGSGLPGENHEKRWMNVV